ncbi:penicillin acylase family protein [Flavilitoribacter nigricans]|uniref:Penicillin acylase family protein n=1 Tax=Flavilitoribacter nigricans (strain ATCC 23147 / DSM 23189 / NBRC 102662 / NCIMB 1420 / SS-2) TaxID=1122177 RepID=A0A2D0N247_FLAN2|nr:penicillin acylase family protein [Flavilitoribacter nigricans]PHN01813.1 penicillin acylase family protein [Flavilitoribacter nigricans DSM 23189 = NBRC 102662]
MFRNQLLLLLLFSSNLILAQTEERLQVEGLEQAVEIIVDHWGIPHIYAQTEADLFFAQGYYAARDRLFQFEIWRRQSTGTVAELLGPRELKRDIGTRLFQFRGDIKAEMNHYHPRGELIITAFVRGVNAYIAEARKDPESLPIEFKMLDMLPEPWTPEVVISRHQGLLGNIGDEMDVTRAVALLGPEKVKELFWFHPNEPDLTLDPAIDTALLFKDIMELYDAYRQRVKFQPEDFVASVANPDRDAFRNWAAAQDAAAEREEKRTTRSIGSNNWAIEGELSQSGYPLLANDPHRTQAVPSLRYMAHLVGPGWNVIGGGEPEIPGISIGHNEYGAWGLTVFETDAEDLYVYRTHPENPDQYWYRGAWENMLIIPDTIPVKGQDPVIVKHRYTRHGPVLYENPDRQQACALRCGWLEIGGSPYLASLRMNQARDFAEFREACTYSHIPGENMVWADKAGNIGWQAVGIAPIRRNFSGMVAVPGDGRYEWDGYLPIQAKPHVYNPESGVIITANENVTPAGYEYPEALGYTWADPYRGNRIREVLLSGHKFSMADMARLQTDYLSIPSRELLPLLKRVPITDPELNRAMDYLRDWDHVLAANSVAAGIYNEWERQLKDAVTEKMVPARAREYLSPQLRLIIQWLYAPDGNWGDDPLRARDEILVTSLRRAVRSLKLRLGNDMSKWQYGQPNYKHIVLQHPFGMAVKDEVRAKLEVGPVPRGGNGYTVNSTSNNDNQSSGGSFRMLIDTGDWDYSLGTNNPGQAGNPDDVHYRNLFDIWAKDQYFPVFYSRAKVESVAAERIRME